VPAEKFIKNFRDRSTDSGFQFEFFCERGHGQWMPNWLAYHFPDACNYSYISSSQPYPVGMANRIKEVGSWLANKWPQIGKANDALNQFHKEAWDNALSVATEEAKRKFKYCTACEKWVCLHACWNEPAGLCRSCAGFRFGDLSAKTQVKEKGPEPLKCRHCGNATEPGKFCDTCGKSMALKVFCGNCGKGIESDRPYKFCPHCGDALAYIDELA
jgi:hypothetical protein